MKLYALLSGLLLSAVLEAKLPALIPYRSGNLWGYCDSSKKILIVPQWEMAGFFDGKTACVRDTNGKYGIIDQQGKYTLEPEYGWMDQELVHGLRTVATYEGDLVGMADSTGRLVLPCEYFWFHWEGVLLQASRRCMVGVLDSACRVVVPFRYKACGDFPASMGDSAMFALCRKGKWGVIDTSAKIIIPFRHYWVTAEGNYWHVYSDWGEGKYYTSRGELIGDSVYIEEVPFPDRPSVVNGMRRFQGTNGLWGFEDEQYHRVIDPKYPGVDHFNEWGLAQVTVRKGNCEYCFVRGCIDKHGTEYWTD